MKLSFRFELYYRRDARAHVIVCCFEPDGDHADDIARAKADALRAHETACKGGWTTAVMADCQVSPLHVIHSGHMLARPLRPSHDLPNLMGGTNPPDHRPALTADAIERAYARAGR